jgi:hypothetical protein
MVRDFDETKRSSAIASRRWFLNRILVVGSAGWVWPSLFTGCNVIPDNQQMSSAQTRNASDVMDEALGMLSRTGPEYRGGLANHGPMAAEALVTLGRLEAVIPWVERYKRNLQDPPTPRDAITANNWREALGQYRRVGDWIAFFDRQLKEKPWSSVLNEWIPRLAPGLVAAAAHGLIRTGHAARSLSLKDNPARRLELAHGLAYWAARYQVLPGSIDKSKGALTPGQALKQVELLPAEGRRQGLISEELDRLATLPSFAKVAGLVDASGNPALFLSDLTENFARVYVENARGIGSVIAFIHAVTGPSAIRLLLPYVKPEDTANLLRFGWQAAAGLYAAYGAKNATADAKPKDPTKEDLIGRAVASDDEHAIKFTEACLREYSTNPKPVYLQAAHRAVETLSGR